MSQLTITSFYVRKGIKIGIISLLSFIILKTGYTVLHAYWLKLNPPPEPPPNTAYGKLPKINFPDKKEKIPVNFQLQTVENQLPTNLPTRGFVYYLPKVGGKFLSLDQANQIANNLKLNTNRKKITENIYRYTNPTNKTELEINVLTQNFTYSYNYLYDQTLINPPPLPSKDGAVRTAHGFLGKINKLTTELENGHKEVSYWQIRGEQLAPSISASEADFIRINLFRQQIDEQYPIMPPTYPQALVSLLITSRSVQGSNVVEAKYTHFESDREEFAEYPLLPIENAWENLKSGNYYLASFEGNAQTPIKIRNIYLAYYDPQLPTQFLQPIFVFEGDGEFVGYYPAVPPEWQE